MPHSALPFALFSKTKEILLRRVLTVTYAHTCLCV